MKNQQIDTRNTSERKILDLSKTCSYDSVFLGKYEYSEVKEKLVSHRHNNMIEICYLDRGIQFYRVEDKIYKLKGGDILITLPEQAHGTSDYPEDKGRLFWLIIRLPEPDKSFLQLSAIDSQMLFKQILRLKEQHFQGNKSIKSDLKNIFKLYEQKETPLIKIEISILILQILIGVIKSGNRHKSKTVSLLMSNICNFIKENIEEELQIEQLAEKAALSLSRFKHRFKQEIGIPPGDYILRQKIDRAKQLLNNRSLSISDIAYRLDFSSPSYFATVFRRYEGISPTKFLAALSSRN